MDAIRSTLSQGGPFKTHDGDEVIHLADYGRYLTLSQGGPFKTHDHKTICAVFPVSSRHICERLPKTTLLLRSSSRL
jgi:hypothetical protein